LKTLFHYLNENDSLFSIINGKKTGVVFFLDKDVDDLCGGQITSEHIVYTYYYEVENHIVEHGNLNKGCCAAASMDSQDTDCQIVDQAAWLRDAALRWKEWVTLCLFSRMAQIRNASNNYSRESQINIPPTEEIDTDKYNEILSSLKRESGLSATDFENEFARISAIVEGYYQNGEHGRIFKGKWYAHFMAAHVRQVTRNAPGNVRGIEDHIIGHIANTLDFNASWADYFKRPLRIIIDKLDS
jgi:hypothetical protein